jgi:hypothetical protein
MNPNMNPKSGGWGSGAGATTPNPQPLVFEADS